MNISVYKTFFIFLIFYLTSCTDDFIDKKPMGVYSENIFYNEKGIDALLIGTYALVGGSSLWDVSWGASIQNWSFGSVASDDAYKGSEYTDASTLHERPYLPPKKTFFYKYQRHELSTTTGWMTGLNANNYRYLRYAHILLWRAEVAAWENDLEMTRQLVNTIRSRAGNEVVMVKVLIHKLPESVYPWGGDTSDKDYLSGGAVDWTQPAANYQIGVYNPFSDQDEAMRAVQW